MVVSVACTSVPQVPGLTCSHVQVHGLVGADRKLLSYLRLYLDMCDNTHTLAGHKRTGKYNIGGMKRYKNWYTSTSQTHGTEGRYPR
jgi:hypothetical protein